MKLAAMEGLYKGGEGVELIGFGILNPEKTADNDVDPFVFKFGFKGMLSYLISFDSKSYVPGINDLLKGDENHNVISVEQRMEKGDIAMNALIAYKEAKASENSYNFV